MSWKKDIFEKIGDFLRFLGYGCLIINGIILAVWTVLILLRFVWHADGWLDRIFFNKPW
jgi:hypothetical protein